LAPLLTIALSAADSKVHCAMIVHLLSNQAAAPFFIDAYLKLSSAPPAPNCGFIM
jgi:hypothetical protein